MRYTYYERSVSTRLALTVATSNMAANAPQQALQDHPFTECEDFFGHNNRSRPVDFLKGVWGMRVQVAPICTEQLIGGLMTQKKHQLIILQPLSTS